MTQHNRKRAQVGSADAESIKLRLSPVAFAVMAVMASGTAMAQEQTVTVTGIRASIENSINVKKNESNIVEAISAEDIGKLPDASVAESVSRLPGVTSQRNKITGKSSSVSVRGMSPDFNGGLLNGREQASTGDSRGVEFDQFPAELLNSVVIYKTPDAGLLGQGLSSTIDLRTVRPLDYGKRAIAANYRKQTTGIDSGAGEGDGTRKSFSYVDQFMDRKLGVALGFVKFKDTGAEQQRFNSWGGWTPEVDYQGAKVKAPGGFGFDTEKTASDRDGAMAVVQFKPSKDFESTLDYFASEGKFVVSKKGLEGPVAGLSAGEYDTGGSLVNATISGGVATSGTFTNFRGVVRNHGEAYNDSLKSVGWENKFKMGEWTGTVDLSRSNVKRTGERFETTAGLPATVNNPNDTVSFSGFNGSNFDQVKYTLGLDYSDPALMKLTNVQGWGGGAQDGYIAVNTVEDSIKGFRASARRDVEYGAISGVEIGFNISDREKSRVVDEGAVLLLGKSGKGAFSDVPNPGKTQAGGSGLNVITWDPSGSLGTVYQSAGWTQADILAKNWVVNEKVSTTYFKGDIDGKLLGRNWRGNFGVQMAQTDQSSQGFTTNSAGCAGTQCNKLAAEGGKSFTDFLPSLNLSTDLGNNQVIRVGVGKVLARPSMADMKPSFGFGYSNENQRYEGSGGNPELEPFRANAFDLSYEKYFAGNKGYIAVAGFYKDLESFIVKTGTPYNFSSWLTPNTTQAGAPVTGILTKPVNGSGGSISGFELSVSVPFSMATKALDGFGLVVNHSDTSSSLNMPASGFSVNDVGTSTIPLPGLSKKVTNAKIYFEKWGFQAAYARRSRSDFLGEITDFQDNRQLTYIKGEAITDLQLGYGVESGRLKGLSVIYQISNLGNAEFKRYKETPANIIETIKYGKTQLIGVNYKF